MKRLTLVLVAVLAFVAAVSIVARAQNAGPQLIVKQFDYLRVAPYASASPESRGVTGLENAGYRACAAANTAWVCREFPTARDASDTALRTVLSTLGNEGWELVSTVGTNVTGLGGTSATEVIYLFKRERQ